MTTVEQRFPVEYRSQPTDEPGLVLETDGTVWVVRPNGSRFQIVSGGGGGGLAGLTTLTTDEFVELLPDTPNTSFQISPTDGNQLVFATADGQVSLTINPGNGMQFTGPGGIAIAVDTNSFLGFFGANPVAKPAAPSSAQELYDGLVSLGLVAGGGTIIESAFAPITEALDLAPGDDFIVFDGLVTAGARFLTFQPLEDLLFTSSAHMAVAAIAFTRYESMPDGEWLAAPTLAGQISVGLAQLSGGTGYPTQIAFPLAGPIVGTETVLVVIANAQDSVQSSTTIYDDGGGNSLDVLGMTTTSFDALVSVEILDPGVDNHALRVIVVADGDIVGGWIVTVELGTDGSGTIVSTWQDVQAAIGYLFGTSSSGSLSALATPLSKTQMGASSPGTISPFTATLHIV